MRDYEAVLKMAAVDASRATAVPRQFEHLVAEIFAGQAVSMVELTQPSKDSDVDVVVQFRWPDKTVELLYVQCKSGDSNVSDLRELIGVVGRDDADAGLLVSLGKISASAASEAAISKIFGFSDQSTDSVLLD